MLPGMTVPPDARDIRMTLICSFPSATLSFMVAAIFLIVSYRAPRTKQSGRGGIPPYVSWRSGPRLSCSSTPWISELAAGTRFLCYNRFPLTRVTLAPSSCLTPSSCLNPSSRGIPSSRGTPSTRIGCTSSRGQLSLWHPRAPRRMTGESENIY